MKKVWRRGPDRPLGYQPGFNEIRNFFDFRGVKIGGWVKPDEQQQRAEDFFIALLDLKDILNLPPFALSLRGQLSIHYGTGGRPGVCAHYQPSSQTLALAKHAGIGSLAHEWAHALDHYLAKTSFDEPVGARFATSAWLANFTLRPHPINDALERLLCCIYLSDDQRSPSAFVTAAVSLDQQNESVYWSLPEELFARAFEAWISRSSIKNNLLINAFDIEKDAVGRYPTGSQGRSIDSAFSDYFKVLSFALNRS